MAGVYLPRHPERTVLYRVLFHHFDRFLTEYESRFKREYGFFRFHPHLHFLVTEGGVDEAGVFHKIQRIDDSRLAEVFAREVLAMLVRKELLSPEWAERILSWRHIGFNVHSQYIHRSSETDVCDAEAPAPHVFEQVALAAAEESMEYF
jgi:hypothetical protein